MELIIFSALHIAVCFLLFAIGGHPHYGIGSETINYQLAIINYQLPIITYFTACNHASAINCAPAVVVCTPSPVQYEAGAFFEASSNTRW